MKHQLTILVLGEVSRAVRGNIFQRQQLQSAPHYFEMSVPNQVIIGEETVFAGGKEATMYLKGYPPDILVLETTLEVSNIFDQEKVLLLEDQILEKSYEILSKRGGRKEASETYSVFSVIGYTGDPEQFYKHAEVIASLLKSEKTKLDPEEVSYTMSAQIKYADNDAAIIDWDGAFLFDAEGDTGATVELLALANLQLLRYRILDRHLDERLEEMAHLVKMPQKKFLFRTDKEMEENLRGILKSRLSSIRGFQSIEREIKLIGDWYFARVYDIASKKFKINEWRTSIKEKLESIEGIYNMVVENFTISGKDRAEWIQIIAWFFLQIGWFVLIILEFIYFTK